MTVRRTFAFMIVALLGVVLFSQIVAATLVESQEAEPAVPQQLPDQPPPDFSGDFQGVFPELGTEGGASAGISALGSVEAAAVISLSFQTSGMVEAVYVETGDYVEAGEVLADIDATSAWDTYNRAMLDLESAQIAMSDLLAPPTEAEISVAQAQVVSAQAAYSANANTMTETEQQVAQMQYDQQVAQLESLRLQRANSNGSAEQIALMEAQIGAATFNTEISRLQLEAQLTPDSSSLWSASLNIQKAQLNLEELQAGPTQAEIDNAQLSINRAQAAVEAAQLALTRTQLVTPRAGYVTVINIAPEQATSTATAAIEISDISQLYMTVPVNELDIGQVSEGLPVTVELDALPDIEIEGTVENVGWLSVTSNDGIVTYSVRIALNTTDPRVLSGMSGEVLIETASDAS